MGQPTFRIARYEALFEGIIKNTSKSHPDHKLLTDVLANFKSMLTQVNNEVDRTIRNMRLHQLDYDYSTKEFPIFKEKR